MKPEVVTIGAHGWDKDAFFAALQKSNVTHFCDIRQRRGMRGSLYTFANSARLQQRLAQLDIRYLHLKEFSPNPTVREEQNRDDKEKRVGKRTRLALGDSFTRAYTRSCLDPSSPQAFMEKVGPEARVICLFCVERLPQACHRSILAAWLAAELDLSVRHILP